MEWFWWSQSGAGNPSIDGSLSDPELVRKLLECQVASWRAANIRDMALVMAFYQMNLNYRTSHIYANIELSCLNGATVCSAFKKKWLQQTLFQTVFKY